MHIISGASIEDFTCLVFLSAHSLLVSHISLSLRLTLQISFRILVDVISVTYITDSVSITASLGDFILSSQIALHMIQTSQILLQLLHPSNIFSLFATFLWVFLKLGEVSLPLHISFQLLLALHISFQLILPLRTMFPSLLSSWILLQLLCPSQITFQKILPSPIIHFIFTLYFHSHIYFQLLFALSSSNFNSSVHRILTISITNFISFVSLIVDFISAAPYTTDCMSFHILVVDLSQFS